MAAPSCVYLEYRRETPDIAEATKDAPMDVREKITRPVGRIAFLGHTDVVYFRNVRIKRL